MTLNKFNKFSFKSENLVVDYFEFKFDALAQYRKQKIVEFFFKLGFNSFDVDKKYRESRSTEIQNNPKNQYDIQFVCSVITKLRLEIFISKTQNYSHESRIS